MKKSNFNFDVLDVPVSIKNKLIEQAGRAQMVGCFLDKIVFINKKWR
jgi:hypothetical protein